MDKKETTKKQLRLVRGGEFGIQTYGDNHCGTTDAFKIRYHLTCECGNKLDNRGFLFDQINIQNFFESIGRTQLSCELLTIKCLEQLLGHILAENPTCQIYKMELTLSPEPFAASLTHSWSNDNHPLKRLANRVRSNKRLQEMVKAIGSKIGPASALSNLEAPAFTNASDHKGSHDHYKFDENL